MIFAGLSLAQIGWVFGSLALGVVALYLLKLRRRTVSVAFSPLWERVLRDKDATALFSRLKRLSSMLLQLVLLALLVLALADPRARDSLLEGRTMVVILDASASMQATDVAPNRLAAAKEAARKLVRGLGGGDKALVAQMASVVTPLGPMTGDASTLEREIDAVQPTDEPADFPSAMRFATDVLRGTPRGEVAVVSDGALGNAQDAAGAVHIGDAKLSFVPIGRSDRNVGITAFSVRRYPLEKSRYEVMLELTNTSASPEDVEIRLMGDGALVDLSRVSLKPGEKLPRFYPQLSGASRTLEARISRPDGSHDELAVDDSAFALLPERRRLKVLVVGPGNAYLEAALLLDEYLDVTQVPPESYPAAGRRGPWDAMIFDRFTPDESPSANAFYLDPSGPGSPVKVGAELKSPAFDKIDRKHEVVRFIALDDVNISVGHALVPAGGDVVLGASDGGASPILVAGQRGRFKFVAAGFDVRNSDLPLRPAWPLLVVDALGWFAADDVRYLSSLKTGAVWRIPVDGGAEQATLKLPDGSTQRVAVRDGVAVVRADRTGYYDLAWGSSDAPSETSGHRTLAVNLLDARESAIAPEPNLVLGGRAAEPAPRPRFGVHRELWTYLLVVACLLIALEWATYHRRITV